MLATDHVGCDAARFVNGRQPAPGMRPASYQVALIELLETVARPEIEHLRELVGEIKGGTLVDPLGLPVIGCENHFFLECDLEDRSSPPWFPWPEAPSHEGFLLSCPIDFGRQVGDWNQHINR